MLQRLIFLLVISTVIASAIDFRYAKGNFVWDMGISNVLKSSIELNDKIIGINEQHKNIYDTYWYGFLNMDIHGSEKLDSVTNIMDTFKDNIPMLPINHVPSFLPVPSSFEVRGIDMDIGIGHDLIHSDDGYIGLGVMTGISTPFMKMRNYEDTYKFFSMLLKDTSTDVDTHKLGATVQAEYRLNDTFSVYGTGIYASQIGKMTNSIIDSSMDVEGKYSAIDVGLKFYPSELVDENWGTYLKAGYSRKRWSVDSVKTTIVGIDMPDPMSIFDTDMKSDYWYMGVGLDF